jgi:hypothetical protein
MALWEISRIEDWKEFSVLAHSQVNVVQSKCRSARGLSKSKGVRERQAITGIVLVSARISSSRASPMSSMGSTLLSASTRVPSTASSSSIWRGDRSTKRTSHLHPHPRPELSRPLLLILLYFTSSIVISSFSERSGNRAGS